MGLEKLRVHMSSETMIGGGSNTKIFTEKVLRSKIQRSKK